MLSHLDSQIWEILGDVEHVLSGGFWVQEDGTGFVFSHGHECLLIWGNRQWGKIPMGVAS